MASKYTLLADSLEQSIAAGEYADGSFLPGERVLCERFQVSRVTVRNALKQLVQKKLIVPIVGSGYKVQGKSGSFNRPRSHLIGGIFPGSAVASEFMYVPSILAHMISENLGDDYNLVLANSADNLLREREMVQRLINANVEGLIIMPSYSGGARHTVRHETGNYALFLELYRKGMPIVLVDRSLTTLNHVPQTLPGVYSDVIACGEMLVDEMVHRGYRKIIFHDKLDSRVSFLRHHGYCNAMKKHDLTVRDVLTPLCEITVESCDTMPEQCDSEVKNMLKLVDTDTAFITNSFLVPTLDKFCPEHRWGGHRVEWICCEHRAGWGNHPMMPYPCSVRPLAKMGVRAARKMLALLTGEPGADGEEYLPPEIEY
ncbi:MAG: GntR family transcriptional regulator [Lentisphaeria bacterium]|nr:GntR family transcriptional regulator [Lentisphaeria bacterium]